MNEQLTSDQPDPRLLPLEVVGFMVPSDQLLPCGQEVCTPLDGDCLESGTDSDQAVLSCARFMACTALENTNRESNQQLSLHEKLIRALSVDSDTGIMTVNASDALFDRLQTTGLLERMRAEGYTMQLTFADIDKLKAHNTLGGHSGGDVAIRAVAEALMGLYRRDYDVVVGVAGVLDHEKEVQQALRDVTEVNMVSRFAAGDEMIVISFVPPKQEKRHSSVLAVNIVQEVQRITTRFNDLRVEYPSAVQDLAALEMVRSELEGQGFNPSYVFTSDGQIKINAPLSITFATVLTPIPESHEAFFHAKAVADEIMMNMKATRGTDIRTRGASVDLVDHTTA